jgi:histidyl-tRNA synthetase
MAELIAARVLKGFRDFPPSEEIERRQLSEALEAAFRSFGFVPIDTPALEYAEILLGKGGGETEKQVYRFQDHGGRDVALRFDLTVPFARFMAEHRGDLALPFKRYHIAKVWRGENTQRGRYREFTQCDFDIVGSESAAADFEILTLMRAALRAVGAGDVTIRLNHRGVFNRFLGRLGVADKSVEVLRTVDKLAKIGRDATLDLLSQSVGSAVAAEILAYIEPKAGFEATLDAIEAAAGGPAADSERLRGLRRFMADAGIADVFVLDPSITRGLDYYTGVVYETFLNDLPAIGSVCSGGRYDDLAGLYSKERLPGVGASIGLDRLIAALEELGRSRRSASFAKLAIACVDEALGGRYQALAGRLREAGVACSVLTDPKKLPNQFALAEKQGAAWVLVAGPAEFAAGKYNLRHLPSRSNRDGLCEAEVAAAVNAAV